MLLALLLASILSLGLGGTASDGLGEQGVAPDARLRLEDGERWWQTEAYWSPSDKITATERGGWLAGASADWLGSEHGLLGLRYQHRVGPGWQKDRLWLRGGTTWVWDAIRLQALLDAALSSRDRESGIEGRVWISFAPHLALEIASRFVLFDQGAYTANRRVGSLASLRLWWAPGGTR